MAGLTPDDIVASLLRAAAPLSATQIADHLADHHVQTARAFGFAHANLPSSVAPAAQDLTLVLNGLADAATEHGDVALLEDLIYALADPASAEAAWTRMSAPEEMPTSGSDAFFAVYDLNAGPLTYDFIQFLVLAERFRKAARKPELRLIVIPGEHEGFRNLSQRDHFLSTVSKEWRLRQLVMRAAHLLPSCAGVTRFRSRAAAATFLAKIEPDLVFPPGYDGKSQVCPYQLAFVLQFASQGHDIRSLAAPPVTAALVRRLLREFAGERPVMTITLRQSDFQPERNSQLDQWLRLAGHCEMRGLFPLFIPDTEALLAGHAPALGGFASLPLAALSLPVRAAVYQESWHNMLVNGGPYTLCLYNARVRFSMFKLIVPGVPTASPEFHTAQGVMPGGQLPFAGPLQRWVWDDDSYEALDRELTEIAALPAALPRAGACLSLHRRC